MISYVAPIPIHIYVPIIVSDHSDGGSVPMWLGVPMLALAVLILLATIALLVDMYADLEDDKAFGQWYKRVIGSRVKWSLTHRSW